MTATTEYARRHARVRLADPRRAREVFTVARARGETPAAVNPVVDLIEATTAFALSWLRAA